MIPVAKLAQVAYETHCAQTERALGKKLNNTPWDKLTGQAQANWIAVVQAVRSQLATVQ